MPLSSVLAAFVLRQSIASKQGEERELPALR
jgi:hypothetical protein